jgi:hypothetical protein
VREVSPVPRHDSLLLELCNERKCRDSLLVGSKEGLDDVLELEVIVMEEDVGNDEESVADGEQEDLAKEELVKLQCGGGRQENSLRTVHSDS